MAQNLSSAAVVIGALKVKILIRLTCCEIYLHLLPTKLEVFENRFDSILYRSIEKEISRIVSISKPIIFETLCNIVTNIRTFHVEKDPSCIYV